MMIKNKVQQKLEKEYETLESDSKWLSIRREILGTFLILILGGGYIAGIDAFVVLLIFIGIPFGLVYYSQGKKLANMLIRINDLEKTIMGQKD